MPSWTMASIRAWPNAPRDCLLASTSRSVVTWEVRSVRFLCALSMMPSRSWSMRKLSMVLRVVCSIDWPTRSGDHDGDDNQQSKHEHAEAGQRVIDADRPVTDHEKNLVHAILCNRFGRPARTKREHLW